MPMIRRQIVAQVKIGTTIVRDFLAFRASHSLTDPVARATIVAPYAYGTYDDPVEILCGAIPGDGPVRRFKGRRRTAHHDLYPRNCVMDCVGELSRADEYINWEESHGPTGLLGAPVPGWNYGNTTYVLGLGGLRVQDIVPASGHYLGCATFKQIAEQVLTKAHVPFNPANIQCTGRIYGFGIADPIGLRFLWHSGTGGVAGGGDVNLENAYRRAGESALSYLQKYAQIEAEFDLGPGPGPGLAPNKIGFYRLFELPSGEVVIKLVGGHPGGVLDYDPYSGRMYVFTEGGSAEIKNADGVPFPPAPGTPNILTANFQRGYPLGNRTLVIGTQLNAFQMHYEASADLSPFMPISTYHYDPSPPSSDWIDWMELGGPLGYMERAVSAKLASPAGAGDVSITPDTMVNFPEPPFVLRCAQTLEQMLVTASDGTSWTVERGLNGTTARDISAGFLVRGPARTLPVAQRFGMDCETVAKARLMDIAREVVSGQLTTCDDALLQPGQVHLVQGPAGIADRLKTAEPLWCQGNDFELEIRDGAPFISQTPSYLGGGLDILPPGVVPIRAVLAVLA